MKLLYKNILISVIVSVLILVFSQFIIYKYQLNHSLHESKEHLFTEKKEIETKLKNDIDLQTFKNNIGDEINIKEIKSLQDKTPYFKTILLREENNQAEEGEDEEDEEFETQALVFECTSGEKNYEVTIIKTIDTEEKLGQNILLISCLSVILLILVLSVIKYFIYSALWKPFYMALKTIQNFNLSKQDHLIFSHTNTKEFNDLNNALSIMSEKVTRDFTALKEFTENASHEIQTPLAVINSKIEMCLQESNLSGEQAILLTEASHAVSILSNLNKGLILLSKLDNNQFEASGEINVFDIISKRIQLLEDFIQERNLTVSIEIDKKLRFKINPYLAEILFGNLIKNAVKHNEKGGKIMITADKEKISIINTGTPPKVSTDKLFERFYKDSKEQSLGLGLSIVKRICEISGIEIAYTFKTELHCIILKQE